MHSSASVLSVYSASKTYHLTTTHHLPHSVSTPAQLCLPIFPFILRPIYAPPYYLCIEKSSKASAHHTLIRVIPGKKREEINLGSSGRGARCFPLAYVRTGAAGTPELPPTRESLAKNGDHVNTKHK